MTKRPRRLAFALGFLTLVACALILEGGVRLADAVRTAQPRARPQNLPLMQPNPFGTGSYRLRANLDIRTRVETTPVRIRTNAHGMNWRDTDIQGTSGRDRVAFFGDSFTFGSWARDAEHTFVGVFEARVSPARFEALNFGVGGFGLLDEELMLKEVALGFKPRHAIVVSYMGNDFRDTWLGLNREDIVDGVAVINRENLAARVPGEFLKPDDRIPIPCDPPLWRRIAERSAAFRRAAPLLDLENLCVVFRPNLSFMQPAFWSRVPAPPIVLQAREAVAEAIDRMNALAANNGIRLAVVALPTSAQVYAREPSGRAFDTAYPQAYLETTCRDRRIPYLDLLPLLRRQAAESNRRLYYRTDTHLTDFGHRKVGELIGDWFLSNVQAQAPPR